MTVSQNLTYNLIARIDYVSSADGTLSTIEYPFEVTFNVTVACYARWDLSAYSNIETDLSFVLTYPADSEDEQEQVLELPPILDPTNGACGSYSIVPREVTSSIITSEWLHEEDERLVVRVEPSQLSQTTTCIIKV